MEKVILFDRANLNSIEMFHPSPEPKTSLNWLWVIGGIIVVGGLIYMAAEQRRKKDV